MKLPALGSHFRLLFRSYMLLVVALLGVAMALDYAFERLQAASDPVLEPATEAALRLVEDELARAPASQRDRVARDLGERIAIPLRLLAVDDVAGAEAAPGSRVRVLANDQGDLHYLYESPALDSLVYMGPIATPSRSWPSRLVTPLFYLSIFVLVGLWLRPILKDIDQITGSASRFAADYREPLTTARETTQLTSLAESLDAMSSRIGALIQNQKELIAALSHEMRTPLARIRFALAVMAKDADEELRRRLDKVGDDVQEIDDLIASMLNYARLDHPDLAMHWQRVPVNAWLRQQTGRLDADGAEIEIVQPDPGDTVAMDPRLMGLALSNLLSNAQRYGKGRVRVSFSGMGEDAVLRVEDDGDGIPESERDNVFKAFTRVDGSRTRETGGYGLGLAIVARIAALHGGGVTVADSDALGGAGFTLRWPRRVSQSTDSEPDSRARSEKEMQLGE